MALKLILIFSIVLQLCAAVISFRLIGITGRRGAWTLISLALSLMAVRRILPLYHLMTADIVIEPDPLNESIGLVLSLLMLIGMARIGPIFMERRLAEEEVNRLNAELEQRVAERTSELEETNFRLVEEIGERKELEKELRKTRDGLELRVRERTAELQETMALVEAERSRFREVLDQLPAYLVLLTPDYHVQFANRFFEQRFGKPGGRRCFEYLFNRTEPCEICETYTVLNTMSPHEWEWTGPDGRNYQIYDFPFADTDGSSLIMEVGLDITEKKHAEDAIKALNEDLEHRVVERTAQLEATNSELEAFAYSVSHDLRTPLRAIDGFSQVLLEDYHDKLDGQGQDCLRRVRAASQRMGRLIDDILKLSRISRSEITCRPVDMSTLSASIARELEELQPERKGVFVIKNGVVADGDPRLLRGVLQNLLGNAWKFTGKRQTARIEFGLTEKDGSPVYFVRDNGAGFDMAYESKLFNAFQRLHTEDEFSGSGIGLALVQRVIRRHGGEIWAEGGVGEGATFYFTLGDRRDATNNEVLNG